MSTVVEGTPGLTVVDPQFEKARRATFVGMAGWATTGPPNTTCRLCQHWHGCGRETGRYASHGLRGGLLKPRPCGKYQQLMNGKVGPGVPHDTAACRFFEANPHPPSINSK